MKTFTVFMLILFVFSANAAETTKKKKFSKTQELSFDAADVDGQVRSPDGSYVQQKKGIKFLPVYKVEKRFDKNIKESVEYLR